jgi:hypothetical protein
MGHCEPPGREPSAEAEATSGPRTRAPRPLSRRRIQPCDRLDPIPFGRRFGQGRRTPRANPSGQHRSPCFRPDPSRRPLLRRSPGRRPAEYDRRRPRVDPASGQSSLWGSGRRLPRASESTSRAAVEPRDPQFPRFCASDRRAHSHVVRRGGDVRQQVTMGPEQRSRRRLEPSNRCYLCGQDLQPQQQLTRDHVPPKRISRRPSAAVGR